MPRVLVSAALLAVVGLGKEYSEEELNQGCPDSPQCCSPSTCWGWLGAFSSMQCAAWRGDTTCDGAGLQSGWCRCTGKAICNENGHCESQAGVVEAASTVNCPKDYVGTCVTSGCDASRGPTACHLGHCVCAGDTCSVNGMCVEKNAEQQPSEQDLKDVQAQLQADLQDVEEDEKNESHNTKTSLYEKNRHVVASNVAAKAAVNFPMPAVAGVALLLLGGVAMAVQRGLRGGRSSSSAAALLRAENSHDAEQPVE